MYVRNLASAEFAFAQVEPQTLKDKIANDIQLAIVTGQLRPGDRIVESKLARQMNVAQTTVREAIQIQANQGLLVKRVNRDTMVRKLTSADLEKLFRLRIELEGLAVELAHSNIDEKALTPLRQTLEHMRRAARVKDIPEFYRFDMLFHKQLGALANNEFLERALVPVSVGPIAFVLAGSGFPLDGNYIHVVDDHAEILEAFTEKTPEEARRVMEAKLRGWYEMQICGLRGRTSQPAGG